MEVECTMNMKPAWMISIRKVNRKFSDGIDRLAGYAVVLLCSVMTIVVLLGVFFRYVLIDPLVWSEELSTFAMVWVTMIGGSMGIKRYSHVGVSYVVDNVPFLERHRNAVGVLVNVLILFFLVMLLKEAKTLALFASRQISPALGISMFWPYCGLIVGGLMMALQVFSLIVVGLTGGGEKFVDTCSLGESA
jgi:TRAP-type C4-dicarboxylate transport system permease small subunit